MRLNPDYQFVNPWLASLNPSPDETYCADPETNHMQYGNLVSDCNNPCFQILNPCLWILNPSPHGLAVLNLKQHLIGNDTSHEASLNPVINP
jgi:hypothetical protein